MGKETRTCGAALAVLVRLLLQSQTPRNRKKCPQISQLTAPLPCSEKPSYNTGGDSGGCVSTLTCACLWCAGGGQGHTWGSGTNLEVSPRWVSSTCPSTGGGRWLCPHGVPGSCQVTLTQSPRSPHSAPPPPAGLAVGGARLPPAPGHCAALWGPQLECPVCFSGSPRLTGRPEALGHSPHKTLPCDHCRSDPVITTAPTLMAPCSF